MSLEDRLERERRHGLEILRTKESNWGWNTPAGKIRWQRRLDYLASALGGKDGDVLEIGAGTGTFTVGLAAVYRRLTAIDISPDLLQVAAQRAPGVRFECADAHELPFPDASFDAVIGCSVLHHLDWGRALKSFFRVLRPSGIIRFSEPNLLNPQIFLQKNIPALKRTLGDSPDEYAFTGSRIQRDLAAAGFTSIIVRPYEFLHPSTPAALIDSVRKLEALLDRLPLRHFGGSLLIEARKPR
jgi:ubiquinone/menaquinone biosynthesis C-methylase UbiE